MAEIIPIEPGQVMLPRNMFHLKTIVNNTPLFASRK